MFMMMSNCPWYWLSLWLLLPDNRSRTTKKRQRKQKCCGLHFEAVAYWDNRRHTTKEWQRNNIELPKAIIVFRTVDSAHIFPILVWVVTEQSHVHPPNVRWLGLLTDPERTDWWAVVPCPGVMTELQYPAEDWGKWGSLRSPSKIARSWN